MRGLLVLLGLVALAAVVLMALGMLRVEFPKNGMLPTVTFDMKGGHLPTVTTGTVTTNTTNVTVQVPTVEMKNTTVTLPTIEVKQAPGNTTAPAKQ